MSAFATIRRPATLAVAIAATVGLAACGGGRERPQADLAAAQVTTIGVNSYLWRAALDAVSFAPLLQAVLDSRKGQAELSQVLGERVREAVEILRQLQGKAGERQVDGARLGLHWPYRSSSS